ncbi:hypothetical protein [Nocardioides sp. SYSU DS0651]|uniref:hypothetical protein n=1 Tax=Nocardioides sp. SYSU DS0651 TaxID=3415955 RepID=UPI003F4B53D6
MIAATASVAVIVAATWAAGMQTGVRTPHPPADRPVQQETSVTSSGDVGTPQPGVSTLPGSPLSPGLPGTTSPRSERGVDPRADRGQRPSNRDDPRRAGSPRSGKRTADAADEPRPGRRVGQQGYAKKSADKAAAKWGKKAGKRAGKAGKKAAKAGKKAGKKRKPRSPRPARPGRGSRR